MCFAPATTAEAQQSPPPKTGGRAYVPELDGLRAIAVLLVILFHADVRGPFHGGFIGVDIFFVLSAFLITSILVEEQERTGTLRLGRFYWRRAIRLMPALLLLLAVYLILGPIFWPGYPHWRDALIAALYVSNYAFAAAQIPPFISHSWSLSAEEQFYLLWPVTLLTLLRCRQPLVLLGIAWVGLSFLRFTADDWVSYYYGLATHGTGLVMGAILFFLVRETRLAFRPFHALVAGGIVAILSMTAQIHMSALAITVAELAAAVIIGTIITNPGALAILGSRPLVGMGKLSYGLYLWHYPVAFVLREVGGFWPTFLITFALSLGVAMLSYVTVETWAKRFREPKGRALAQAAI